MSDDAVHWRRIWLAGAAQPVWSFELNQPERARYLKLGFIGYRNPRKAAGESPNTVVKTREK